MSAPPKTMRAGAPAAGLEYVRKDRQVDVVDEVPLLCEPEPVGPATGSHVRHECVRHPGDAPHFASARHQRVFQAAADGRSSQFRLLRDRKAVVVHQMPVLRVREVLEKSMPARTSILGVTKNPTSNVTAGALKAPRSMVSWSVTKSYQSLPARLKIQLPLTAIEPSGRPKRKSGLCRGAWTGG